jgi:hypothetical protein
MHGFHNLEYRCGWLALPSEQVSVLKKNLSQIILASACNGKRDVEQLKEIALRGVSGVNV